MAEGGSGSRFSSGNDGYDDKTPTFATEHEEYFDNTCSRCGNEGRVSEAIAYCGECQEEFCSDCHKLHKTFSFSKNHTVLDATQKSQWGVVKKSDTSGTKCEEHEGQRISMYCKGHSSLCCPVCVSLTHKTCHDMVFIPQIAKGVVETSEFKTTLRDMDEALGNINKAKKTKEKDRKSIESSRQRALNEFSRYMNKINATLEMLEDKMRSEIDASASSIAEEIATQNTVLEELKEILTKLRSDLSNNENIDESEFFIMMKMGQKKLDEYGTFLKNCLSPAEPKLMYSKNRSFENVVGKLATLGTTETKSEFTNKLVKVTTFRKQNIKMASDSNKCYIDGLCQMPSGHIIISDKHNKNLKRLDSSYHPMDSCDIKDKPYAICCINEEEIAVACGDANYIQFVNVGNQLVANRTLQFGHRCFGLAQHEGKLYISSDFEQKLFVYDLTGCLLNTIYQNNEGLNVFGTIRHVAVSHDGTKVYVSDRDKGLVILDNKGHQEGKVVSSDVMKATRGVCLDNHGNVYLISCSSGNITQVGTTHEDSINVVVDKQHGLRWPGLALFDKMRHCLLVTQGLRNGSDDLNICYLQK